MATEVPLIGAIGFGQSLHDVALALVLLVLAALCTSFGALRLSVTGTKGAASTPSQRPAHPTSTTLATSAVTSRARRVAALRLRGLAKPPRRSSIQSVASP